MALRELVNEIGFRVDVGGLRRAQREGDRITDRISDNFRDMGTDIDRVVNNVGTSIRGIPDPRIDTSQSIRNFNDLQDEIRDSRRELEDLQQEARQTDRALSDIDLGSLAGGLGGGAVGATIGSDITSFAQMPREFQAQLGVDEKVAKELTGAAKEIWSQIPGITKEGAAEAVAASNLYFDATGEKARALGADIVMLSENSGYEITQLAEAAKQMDDRFADIKSPEQALEMLTEASQRLPRHIFEELIDQTGEYGSNLAAAGMLANDFYGAMIAGGEKGRYVIDRLGDAISNEFIGRFRGGDDTVLEALGALSGSEDRVQKWHKAVVAGGEEGQKAIREILTEFTNLEDKQEQAILGVEIFGTMYEEQGQAFLPILDDMADGMDDVGVSVEELSVRSEGPLNAVKMKLKEVRAEIDSFADGLFSESSELIGAGLPFLGAFLGAGGIGRAREVLGGLGARLAPVGAFFRTAAPLVLGFGRALGVVVGIAGGAIGVIAGLGYAGYQLYQNWDEVKGWILGVFDSIGAGAKGMANFVIGGINGVIGALNGLSVDVPDWVPKYGGRTFSLNIPQIPMLAQGTDYFSGGIALVGEEGPELVNLPRGAQVLPNDETMSLLNQPTLQGAIDYTNNIEAPFVPVLEGLINYQSIVGQPELSPLRGEVTVGNAGTTTGSNPSFSIVNNINITMQGGSPAEVKKLKKELERLFPELANRFFRDVAIKVGIADA